MDKVITLQKFTYHVVIAYCLHVFSRIDKTKPAERQGRKATGLTSVTVSGSSEPPYEISI